MDFSCDLRGFSDYVVAEHIVLEHEDLKATNTLWHPENVVPHARGNAQIAADGLNARLPKASWNVIRLVKVNDWS